MPSTGTAPGVSKTPASVNSNQRSFASTPEVLPRVLQGAHCFYWIVGLVVWNSLFTILGSHLHRFTELGVAIIAGSLTQASGIGNVVQVIVGGWAAAGFLVLGYYATEGQEWAFSVGIAAYAVDGALMVAGGDFIASTFHAVVLYVFYRGFAALGKTSGSKASEPAAAAYAG